MNKKVLVGVFIFLMVICFVISCVFAYKGTDKLVNYYNSENYPSLNKNAYVGGDAYNFIINGNYATGFFVLSMGFFLAGILFAGVASIVGFMPDKLEMKREVTNPRDSFPAEELPDL